ncbi:MAG TPA: DNA topology modulation protein [Herpetosiphonaceae bacterium]
MRKIMLIGPGGAGKSTLARHLGAILDIDVIHLDRLFWKPGWIETPRAEWRTLQQRLVQGERWIVDGNYGGTLDIRLAAADTIIFLDLPRWLCLWRVVKRRVIYAGRARPDMSEGCSEKLDWQFLRWIWQYPRTRRPQILRQLAQLSAQKRVIRLRSQADVARFLHEVRLVAVEDQSRRS